MDELKHHILAAAHNDRIHRAVHDIYDRTDQAIARRNPKCSLSGRCCKFEEYGHRLYVTSIELAVFINDMQRMNLARPTGWNGLGCPFQRGKLCTVHKIRPFGCRIFFCDPTATDYLADLYEQFHAELKRLHDQFSVPYAYMEWRSALRQLNLVDPPPDAPVAN